MDIVLGALIFIGMMGALFGWVLGFAAEKFVMVVDPKIERLETIMPGANCGGCGYTCTTYPQALVLKGAPPNKCRPGGEALAKQISEILGVEVAAEEKEIAVLMCNAKDVEDRFIYSGPKICRAAVLTQNGQKDCEYGCLGFGDCVAVCPTNAIVMRPDGIPEIIEERCVACGKCVQTCPKKLFELRKISNLVHVRCKSLDKGAAANKKCGVSCIACKKCEKICPYDAIHIKDNLAVIDYDKCTSCGECVPVCPNKVIWNYEKMRPEIVIDHRYKAFCERCPSVTCGRKTQKNKDAK